MKLLTDLQSGQCKYPVSQDEHGDHLFCAEAVRDIGCSYCAAHAALCYVKPVKLVRARSNSVTPPTIARLRDRTEVTP